LTICNWKLLIVNCQFLHGVSPLQHSFRRIEIPDAPFNVPCPCGHVLTGFRQSGFQVIRCPRCGADRFILPRSPFADIGITHHSPLTTHHSALWLLPLVSVCVTAAALVLVYWIFLAPQPRNNTGADTAESKTASERLQQARGYLADGMFRLAADELRGDAGDLTPDDKRHWRQLKREAELLADLSAEPIEDILRHAAGVPEREWQADFPRRYRGKAFVFDTLIRQTANGKLQCTYAFPGPEKICLEIDNLELLRRLPLDQPRRVLFGMRLASVRLEPPGPAWVVRFEADSGVFLTDPKAAGLCCPVFNEPDAARLLEEQAKLALGSN
jgi:hypothetical protein